MFSAVDQPGASGLVGTGAGIFYRLDATPPVLFNGLPFLLPAGQHQLCWHSVDVAGNAETERCRMFMVDAAAPTINITAAPAAPNGTNGWYVGQPVVTVSGADALPGSGINAVIAPAGVFASLDGAAYALVSGPITIPEGLHELRAYAVDVSGQRSPIVSASYRVDLSHPVSAARLVPADPASGRWWRIMPRLVLRATDGEANAGVGTIPLRIDAAAASSYTDPVVLDSGDHSLGYRAADRSGPVNLEAEHLLAVPVDITAPRITATQPQPLVWIKLLGLLGPAQAKLGWQLSDDLSRKVHIRVLIHDPLGRVVRRIDDGLRDVTPGVTLNGQTLWDGKDDTLTGLVPLGIYYYRVVAIDEAGNVAQSGESKPIEIKVGL
jgi:hypothetical protein